MNEEKPSEPKADGRPFDGAVGPTAQADEGLPVGRPQLGASRLRGDTTTPSWEAPRQEDARWSTGRIITIVILLALLAVVTCLETAGVL
jgi:hypothetical protein